MASNPISNTWSLTKIRIRLAMRNKMFLFFSLLMPMIFLFLFAMLWGKGSPEKINFILGGILTLTVMGGFWGLSVQLVSFRELGILRRFRLAPLGSGPMLASSIVANFILVVPFVFFEMLVAKYILHMASWGNIPAIFLLVMIGSATFSAFGLVVASVTNTMQETQIINQLIWMVFLFLSGATIPLAVFPGWIQRITLFSPATYLAVGLQSAATNQVVAFEILTEAAALILGLLVAFEISRRIFRWEPEAKVPARAKIWVLAALIPFLAFGAYENYSGRMLKRVSTMMSFIDRPAAGASAKPETEQ
ncbi:MAG: ABC transporter permease [Candidatus Acidiferrales bacterium]